MGAAVAVLVRQTAAVSALATDQGVQLLSNVELKQTRVELASHTTHLFGTPCVI
jgi:nitrous oxide reductase accessory protein NosL